MNCEQLARFFYTFLPVHPLIPSLNTPQGEVKLCCSQRKAQDRVEKVSQQLRLKAAVSPGRQMLINVLVFKGPQDSVVLGKANSTALSFRRNDIETL